MLRTQAYHRFKQNTRFVNFVYSRNHICTRDMFPGGYKNTQIIGNTDFEQKNHSTYVNIIFHAFFMNKLQVDTYMHMFMYLFYHKISVTFLKHRLKLKMKSKLYKQVAKKTETVVYVQSTGSKH